MNVAKHAGTDQASVRLRCDPGMVRLEVQDAGRGFDPLYAGPSAVARHNTTSPASSKFGLFAIRERMKALGATFEMAHSACRRTIKHADVVPTFAICPMLLPKPAALILDTAYLGSSGASSKRASGQGRR